MSQTSQRKIGEYVPKRRILSDESRNNDYIKRFSAKQYLKWNNINPNQINISNNYFCPGNTNSKMWRISYNQKEMHWLIRTKTSKLELNPSKQLFIPIQNNQTLENIELFACSVEKKIDDYINNQGFLYQGKNTEFLLCKYDGYGDILKTKLFQGKSLNGNIQKESITSQDIKLIQTHYNCNSRLIYATIIVDIYLSGIKCYKTKNESEVKTLLFKVDEILIMNFPDLKSQIENIGSSQKIEISNIIDI